MKKKIVIYGAGGFAREVLQIIKDINKFSKKEIWLPLGYLTDEDYLSSDLINNLPIIGTVEWLKFNPDVFLIIGVGSPTLRKRVHEQLEAFSVVNYATLIHPKAWIGDMVEVGEGSIICAGTLITTNIKIGKHVQINIGSTIGHDAILEDFATLNPSVNVSGNVILKLGSEIGTGTVLIPQVEVGSWSIVGAGSVVTKSLPDNITAVGSPAKIIKYREPGWHIVK